MLNHSKASVTIEIGGLALACINGRKQNRCEVGILRCDRHKPLLDIQRIELDPDSGNPLRSRFVPHFLSLDEDIVIDVKYGGGGQIRRGVSTYTAPGFNRPKDKGDLEDFRWIADLEGPEFHDRKLRIRHGLELKPVILIGDGTLYTARKTEEKFARVSASQGGPRVPLGKLGYVLGADIVYPEGSSVVLRNIPPAGSPPKEASSKTLPIDGRCRYVITIENYCELDDESEGTDFRLFYDVLRDPTGRRFDLRRFVETGPYGVPEEPLDDLEDVSLDGTPDICQAAYLGSTETLPHP